MIILASGSPRRRELLKKLCRNFRVEACNAPEIETAENPAALAIKNATIKAETVAQIFSSDTVIGADTIVVLNGEIFGKPHGERGAFEMLKKLSGKKHEVITGLAICTGGKTYTASEVTEVYFGEMTDNEILEYVATGEPLDKSGSYALQGGAAKFIQKINGDWSNVVGLPLYRLRILAAKIGIEFKPLRRPTILNREIAGMKTFFNAIKAKCSSAEEYAAELLKARGFLLEDNALILSDNSFFAKDRYRNLIPNHPMNDASYLNRLLTEGKLGKVEGDKIIIFPGANVEKIFYSNIIGGSESFLAREITWERFLHESFAPKVPVLLLEKFVARYIKAISACGVQTHGSCDGNHTNRAQRILIEISSYPNAVWYSIICQRCLVGRFNLNWIGEITFNRINKWQTYIELNRAAEFLYKHRIKLREIRRKACDEISSEMLNTLSYEELAEIFSSRANKLFDELIFNNDRVHCD